MGFWLFPSQPDCRRSTGRSIAMADLLNTTTERPAREDRILGPQKVQDEGPRRLHGFRRLLRRRTINLVVSKSLDCKYYAKVLGRMSRWRTGNGRVYGCTDFALAGNGRNLPV